MTAYPHRSTDADQCTTLLFRTWGAGQGSGLCLQLSVNLNLLKIKSVAKSSDALEASPPAGGEQWAGALPQEPASPPPPGPDKREDSQGDLLLQPAQQG